VVGEDLESVWGGFCAQPTMTHKLLYPKKLLINMYTNLNCCMDDYKLMEWLFEDIKTNMVSEGVLREVIFICVMGNDSNDPKFIENNPELCVRCGWCCKNCNPIIVRPDEVPKLPDTNNLILLDDNKFTFKIPCKYQLNNNKCGIYINRPDSCKLFPLGVKNGTICVQRDINCMFIYKFLLNKVYFMVNKIYKINNKK